jgi:hypothetical protein
MRDIFVPEKPMMPHESKQLRLRFLAALGEISDLEIAIRIERMIDALTEHILTSQDKYFPLTRKTARERAIEFFAQCVERGADEKWIIR